MPLLNTSIPPGSLPRAEMFRSEKAEDGVILWKHPKAQFELKRNGSTRTCYIDHDPMTLFAESEPLPAKYQGVTQTA